MSTLRRLAWRTVVLGMALSQALGGIVLAQSTDRVPLVEPLEPLPRGGVLESWETLDEPDSLPAEPSTPLGTWECWTPPGTVPCNHHLYAVDALSETDAWAAGEAGTFMHWDGQAWTPVSSPTLASLHAIDMVTPTDGWAAGGGVILHWDGVAWTEVDNPTHAEIASLSIASTDAGWGVGPDNPIVHWDGAAWTEQTRTWSDDLYSVSMASLTDGWAVGGFMNPYGNYDNAVAWRWNGQRWTATEIPPGSSWMEYLSAVDMISANDGWAVGGGYTYRDGYFATILHWNGQSWTRVPAPTFVHLSAVSMSSPTDGWATGAGRNYQTGDYASPILHWDGSTWTEVPDPTDATLYSIVAVSPTRAWAVGANGTILEWDGVAWKAQTHLVAGTNVELTSVDMASQDDGWAIGSRGTILHWNGHDWQQADSPITYPLTETLRSVAMVSADDGWAAGGGTYHNEFGCFYSGSSFIRWDGVHWVEVSNPSGSQLNAIAMVSATDGWAVGGGTILHYTGVTLNYRTYLPVLLK